MHERMRKNSVYHHRAPLDVQPQDTLRVRRHSVLHEIDHLTHTNGQREGGREGWGEGGCRPTQKVVG